MQSRCIFVTSCIFWCGPAMQSHDDWGKGHVSLNCVLPDSVDEGVRQCEVQVTDENNAVFILRRKNKGPAGVKQCHFTHTSYICRILQFSL